jgi:hypothetical protein
MQFCTYFECNLLSAYQEEKFFKQNFYIFHVQYTSSINHMGYKQTCLDSYVKHTLPNLFFYLEDFLYLNGSLFPSWMLVLILFINIT